MCHAVLLLPVPMQAHAVAASCMLMCTLSEQAVSQNPTCSTWHIAASPRPQHARISPNPDGQVHADRPCSWCSGHGLCTVTPATADQGTRPLPCHHLTATLRPYRAVWGGVLPALHHPGLSHHTKRRREPTMSRSPDRTLVEEAPARPAATREDREASISACSLLRWAVASM